MVSVQDAAPAVNERKYGFDIKANFLYAALTKKQIFDSLHLTGGMICIVPNEYAN